MLAGLLVVWGVSATAGNIASGRLTDRAGSSRIINTLLVAGLINFALAAAPVFLDTDLG
jgi:DHA1 family inner membrane transport protein